ncbi:hypothetical protein Goarm_007220 [Gossypium armourianum]|uniref:Uncharacterized protein n=1 Tax=Gossypium armourianum TaxID=34283 RepID=A0A7J9JKG4_9ROSI|nr:hypothetical protein [Gossypium armourianum]
MPGGVNSPVRAFNLVGGQAVVIDSLKGCCVWDTDGNEYVNYVGSWSHADDDEVLPALAETMKKGTSFGTPCLSENVLAETDGSGVATLGLPHSSGVPEAATSETLNNDISAVENNFKRVFWSNSQFNNREEILGGGLPVGSIWREEGDYGDGGTNRANVPGWDLEWEPTGNDSRQLKEPGTYDA